MSRFDARAGEIALESEIVFHERITFIGQIESPWTLDDCPKNLRQARERGVPARVLIAPQFRPALEGIAAGDALVLLYWMSHAPRHLLRQVPRHRAEGTGTFNLRSPVRPNPIGMGVVKVLALDMDSGTIEIDAIDVVNGTPLIDIKPHMPLADTVPV
ncbi:MAG: TrmO family methyltransferase [Roseinatronobacter sp.]